MAAANKCLVQSNKCRTGGEATKKRNHQWKLQQAKSIARHLGLTLRKVRSGDYRVNFRDGNEMTAYYTDNLEDAVKPRSRWPVSERCEPAPYKVGT